VNGAIGLVVLIFFGLIMCLAERTGLGSLGSSLGVELIGVVVFVWGFVGTEVLVCVVVFVCLFVLVLIFWGDAEGLIVLVILMFVPSG